MTDNTPTTPTDVGTELVMPPLEGHAMERVGDLDLGPVLDVPVELSVEIGRTTMTIRETLDIGPGSIVALNRMTGEPVDLLVNGHKIAQGEVVAIDEEFGLRITHVVSPERLLDAAA
jgi:flagellar motor switch protein FliN